MTPVFAGYARLGLDDDLAHGLAAGERLESLRRLGQRIDVIDVAGELALGGPARELVEARAIALGLALHPFAEIDADHLAAFEQGEIERQLRDLAGREADYEVAPFPGDRPQCGFAVGTADRIEDHID